MQQKIQTLDWQKITNEMNDKGFSLVSKFFSDDQCETLKSNYNQPGLYRKTVVMERYRFGKGEYKYYDYPLPEGIQTLRENIYPMLAPIANNWMQWLNIATGFPASFGELQQNCHRNNQLKPTALILKYGIGGHNTMHQDLYGNIFFPMQVVLFLSEPGKDYTGGEFVMLQQTPRAQSKAMVLNPVKGDMLIFTTNFRPVKGGKGYYRVNMKHGVSEVSSGERFTAGIIFHDALS